MELRFERVLPVAPERAFEALTTARGLVHWFCDQAESDPAPQGRLCMIWNRPESRQHPYEARWVAFEPAVRAAFRGGHPGYPHGDAGLIEFTLAPHPDGTTLLVRHAIPDGDEYIPVATTFAAAWPRALGRLAGHLTPNTWDPT